MADTSPSVIASPNMTTPRPIAATLHPQALSAQALDHHLGETSRLGVDGTNNQGSSRRGVVESFSLDSTDKGDSAKGDDDQIDGEVDNEASAGKTDGYVCIMTRKTS